MLNKILEFLKQLQLTEVCKLGELSIFDANLAYTFVIQYGVLVFILSILALLLPNYFGLYGSFILTLIPLFLMWIFSLITMQYVYKHSVVVFLTGAKWFSLPGVNTIGFDLIIDRLSITYVVLIVTIGLSVIIYSFSYFRYEPHVERLFLFINLFMISMCILVLGGNLFVLFLGWELIGLTSFFLINFWSNKISTLKAAFKAFLFNKISDLGILLFIIVSLLVIGDVSIPYLNKQFANYIDYYINIFSFNVSFLELLGAFLMTAVFIKSAQFGTHIWLPDSMEAPVPASALIHSATLVSAGVFILLRFSFLFEIIDTITMIITLIGTLTAAFGGVSACFQSDIKRVLAYSTISHCGFLVFLAVQSTIEVTLFYLCVHGFFKALVFMCVGNVIRFCKNYQDFRYMGGLNKYLPFESIFMCIGLINLSGLPLSFGFFMKHLVLISISEIVDVFIVINLVIGMLCGLVYSFRLQYYIFFDTKKSKKTTYSILSKTNLKSTYYSNTSLASTAAIYFLCVFSVIIITFIYKNSIIFENKYINTPTSSLNHIFTYICIKYPIILEFVSMFVNFFVLIIAFILFILKYRYTPFLYSTYHYIAFFSFFSFFYYLISIIF